VFLRWSGAVGQRKKKRRRGGKKAPSGEKRGIMSKKKNWVGEKAWGGTPLRKPQKAWVENGGFARKVLLWKVIAWRKKLQTRPS